MAAKPIIWKVFLCYCIILVVSGELLDWINLKQKLNDEDEGHSAVVIIASNWEERPVDFFSGINERSWQMIIPNLSIFQKRGISFKEFESSEAACRAFAKYLPELSNAEALPNAFREAVCNLLESLEKQQEDQSIDKKEYSKAIQMIKFIPVSWIKTHGGSLTRALVELSPPRLNFLNKRALTSLLENFDDSCKSITLNALLSLDKNDLMLTSPECVKAINELGTMDLSQIVGNFNKLAFSKYNGPLSKGTIQNLSSEHLHHYGSLTNKDGKTCEFLELHYANPLAIGGVTANCLYGYFSSDHNHHQSMVMVGLGELWKSIPASKLEEFTKDMKSSLVKIPFKDFDSMTRNLLNTILYKFESCPTIETSFWTDERIRYISSKCLHKILIEQELPVKLGAAWDRISLYSFYELAKNVGSFWNLVHLDDHDLVRNNMKGVISTFPKVCSSMDISFWTRETIQYVTEGCLYNIITKTNKPVMLGELWRYIPSDTIGVFKYQDPFLFKNISGSDFQHMSSDFLRLIFSLLLNGSVNYLPHLPIDIILSPMASKVKTTPQQFVDIVRSIPNLAGQILWYSEDLPEDVLSNCNGNDVCSLKFIIPKEGEELNWKGLFTKLEQKYYLTGRAELFSLMIQSISIKSDGDHYCSTIESLEEYLSLPWLGHNLSNICHSKLPFQVRNVSEALKAPELSPNAALPWVEMLEAYSLDDWTKFSARERVATLLGKEHGFWTKINAVHSELFRVLHRNTLSRIDPNFILELGDSLSKNLKVIPFLPDEAFSKHKVGQLPCRPQDLSPGQISQLSRQIIMGDGYELNDGKNSQHVLS